MTTISRHLHNLDFLIRGTLWDNGSGVDVEAIEIVSRQTFTHGEPPPDPPVFTYATDDQDGTTNPDRANRFLRGSIKWDGSSNLRFGDVAYSGDRRGATNVGLLLAALYDLAAEMMPRNAENLR